MSKDKIITTTFAATKTKAETQKFIETFSYYYTPSIIVIAVLIVAIPTLLLGGSFNKWFAEAITLLVIACPCALVLSTPAAIASGLAVGARRGLLIKGGSALETIGQVGEFDVSPGTGIAVQIDVEDAIGVSHQIETIVARVEDEL